VWAFLSGLPVDVVIILILPVPSFPTHVFDRVPAGKYGCDFTGVAQVHVDTPQGPTSRWDARETVHQDREKEERKQQF
jgi:hypothetical protein